LYHDAFLVSAKISNRIENFRISGNVKLVSNSLWEYFEISRGLKGIDNGFLSKFVHGK
jgi:hypothetical protein